MKSGVSRIFQRVGLVTNPSYVSEKSGRAAFNQTRSNSGQKNVSLRAITLERVPHGQKLIYESAAHNATK